MDLIGLAAAVMAILGASSEGAPGLSATAGGPSAAPDPDEVRAIVAEVLADAERRSSLLADGATAGNEKGKFFLASADGAFRLVVGGDVQTRYILNVRGDDNTVAAPNRGDDFDPGFQTRRLRLRVDGTVHRDWEYRVVTRIDSAGAILLQEACLARAWGDGWSVTAGQFKLPLLHEELVSSMRQLAAERSIVNSAFTQGRSQGAQVGYAAPSWNAKVAFSDGLASENTAFTNQSLIPATAGGAPFIVRGEADWALTGRLEVKFAGAWDQYSDFTSRPGDGTLAVLGIAGHAQESPDTADAADVDRRTVEYTADVQVKGGGWSAYGAFIGRHDVLRAAGADTEFDDFGALVQGAYRWGDAELFARWDAIFPDGVRNLREDAYHFLTAGINYYVAGHALKLTADAMVALNQTADIAGVPGSSPGAGSIRLLPSTSQGLLGSSESGEVVVRLQVQLVF